MRNHVALRAARTAAMTSKLVLVMVLVPAALVAVAQGASAATVLAVDEIAADNNSFGILGPVGITAVALGFGGLVIGLLRHRRRETTAAATATAAAAATTLTLPVDPSGALPVLDAATPPRAVEPAAGERVG